MFSVIHFTRFSPMPLLAVAAFILACGTARPVGTGDPVVGRWDGVGFLATVHAVFEKDHTYRMTDDWEKGRKPVAAGTWSVKDGKYILPSDEGRRIGTIDARGQLLITAEGEEGPTIVMQRHGAKPPVPASAATPPKGEWRYVYTSKSTIPANSPPPFDVMIFGDGGKIKLKSSTMAKEFNMNYTLAGDVISVVTGEAALPKLDFRYRWEEGGKTLVLSVPQMQNGPFEFEWSFFKPERFLPNDIPGTWAGSVPLEGMREEVQMGADGRFSRSVMTKEGKIAHQNNAKTSDYYRLWKAPFGNALTIVTLNAEMGAQMMQLFKYEKKADTMTLTPIELAEGGKLKEHKEATFTWKRKQP